MMSLDKLSPTKASVMICSLSLWRLRDGNKWALCAGNASQESGIQGQKSLYQNRGD